MSLKNSVKNLGRVGKSLSISFFSQAATSLVSFVMVPLLIQYLSKPVYGLWVTLISLISWILISDFGIGYGFRNRVTEYLADNDKVKLGKYFRNTFQYYLILTVIVLFLFIFQLFYNPLLSKYKSLCLILYLPYIVYFPFSISIQILQGLRLVHYTALLALCRAALWAAFVAIIISIRPSDSQGLLVIAVGYSVVNSMVNFVCVYLAFSKTKITIPHISDLLTKPVIDETLLTGAKFFVLQVSTLLLFSMGNYYIYSNLTPADTAHYDTVNKVYSLYMTFFNMIISVYWSEIVYQKTAGNYIKLKEIYKKLVAMSAAISLGSILIALAVPTIISVWTNNAVKVDVQTCIPFSFMVSIQSAAYAGAVFLNAFEKVVPQLILAFINIAIILPLIKLGFHLQWGMSTVPLVSAVLTLPSLIVCHIRALDLIKFKHRLGV